MTKCIILASSDDRTNILNHCVECIKNNNLYKDTDVLLFFQGSHINEVKDVGFFKKIIISKKLRGIFTPRYELFKLSVKYDYTILIDDDLFLYPDTSYETAIDLCQKNPFVGCVSMLRHLEKCQSKYVCVSDKMGYYNVSGGLVFPKRSVKIILEYFADKEKDYTEDMFWLLLYVKGYDLWRDYHSKAVHLFNVKGKQGQFTGYSKMRVEKPYVPMLSEYYDDTPLVFENGRWGTLVRDTKSLEHINKNGLLEREKNRADLERRYKDGKTTQGD